MAGPFFYKKKFILNSDWQIFSKNLFRKEIEKVYKYDII